MGSNCEATSMKTKKLIHPKVNKPEVKSLKDCVKLMTNVQCMTFSRRYGKILELLEVDVQVEAITALAQYYDPPMRCFTFRNFQMAPTLEEFEQILGYPMENTKPYQYLGHSPSIPTVAEVLRVPAKELRGKKLNRSGFEGFPQKYLEERMRCLAEVGDWASFMDILALTIYGVILFPRIDDYVDFGAIDVFLAFKSRGENPVPAVLADTYCTLNHCYEKKGKKISCCLQTLYVWLVTHMFHHKCKVSCPIEDFQICNMEAKNNRQWPQSLVDLNEDTVRWYPQWREIREIIYQCGKFPNVPLMGVRGCINYNPCMALRQLGYRMMSPPTKEMIDPFVVYEKEMKTDKRVEEVRQAWERVIRKSKELGKRCCDATESYCQWLQGRVREIKLPFENLDPDVEEVVEEAPAQIPISIEEVEELRAALLKSEEKNKKLEEELAKSHSAYKDLQFECKQKDESLEKANKRARVEGKCKGETQSCLWAVNKELKLRGKEKKEALMEVQRWKESSTKSQIAEKSVRRQLEDLKQQLERVVAEYERRVRDEKQQKEEYQEAVLKEQENARELESTLRKLKSMVAEYKKRVDDEKQKKEEISMEYQWAQQKEQEDAEKLKMYEESVNLLWQESMTWRGRYIRVLWEAREVPRRLREAEEMMNPLAVPAAVSDFFEFCKNVLKEVREVIGCNH